MICIGNHVMESATKDLMSDVFTKKICTSLHLHDKLTIFTAFKTHCIQLLKELIKKLVRAMHRNLSIPYQIFSALLETNAC